MLNHNLFLLLACFANLVFGFVSHLLIGATSHGYEPEWLQFLLPYVIFSSAAMLLFSIRLTSEKTKVERLVLQVLAPIVLVGNGFVTYFWLNDWINSGFIGGFLFFVVPFAIWIEVLLVTLKFLLRQDDVADVSK